MSGPWVRLHPDRVDTARALVVAGAVAAGVGLMTFYLTRLLSARERLSEGGPPGRSGDTEGGAGGA